VYVVMPFQCFLMLAGFVIAAVGRWYRNLPRGRIAVPQHTRFWAGGFLVSGIYALACIPAVFLIEHFQWWEWQAPIHLTSFCACIACITSALMYLLMSRRRQTGQTPTRALAYVAVVLAGGYLILVFTILLMLTFAGADF
jgi:hypothetical protein